MQPEGLFRTHKCPPPVPILSQFDLVQKNPQRTFWRSVMYIQNVHLKLYLYFSDKLLSIRTGILETFVSRWFSTFIKPHGENAEMTRFARSWP